MIHPMLQQLADEALRKGRGIATDGELLGPVLVLQAWDGEVHRYRITLPDVPPHHVIKVLLAGHRALHAAVCLEGWGVIVQPPPEGPERDAFERQARRGRRPAGMPQPRDHPDRYDVLVLLGQTRGAPDSADTHIHRQWRITNGRPRTFEEQKDLATGEYMRSNFWPLFVSEQEVRDIAQQYVELTRLMLDTAGRRS